MPPNFIGAGACGMIKALTEVLNYMYDHVVKMLCNNKGILENSKDSTSNNGNMHERFIINFL